MASKKNKMILGWTAALVCIGQIGWISGCKDRQPGPVRPGAPVAWAIDKPSEKGPLCARVRLDKAKVSIADTLLLELSGEIEPGYKLTMPRIDKALDEFGLIDWDSPGERLTDKGRRVKTYRYRLEPLVSGQYSIPAFTFHFQDVNDPNKAYTLDTECLDVEVTSLPDVNRADLKIADIEGVVEVPKPRSYAWIWVTGLASLLIAAPGLWWFLRKGKIAEGVRVFRPAHEVAYDRLKAMVELNLVEQGRIKEFYERISGILRHYIEDRFHLHAPHQSTEEFLYTLAGTDALARPDKETLAEFLNHCDLVKFAAYRPQTDQIQRTFDLVKAFIEKTRSDQHRVDVTDQGLAQGGAS